MSFKKFSKSSFGNNYEKARKNFELATKRERLEFKKKYPSADMNKFVFDADLSKTGDLLTTTTKHRNDNGELFDIMGYLFKKNYLDTLHWVPRIWDVGGTVQPFVLAPSTLLYDVKKFTIYMNERIGFWCNSEALNTSWKGTADDITKVAVDKDDPYFASLLAACIISHVSEISRKHLTGDNKVITSIAKYYIYYHMKRFTDDPRKMNSYIMDDVKELVKANLQTKTTWANKFVRTRENISLWYQQHPNQHNIRNYKYRMSKNHTGVLGIDYQEVFKVENNSDTDWMCFIKEDDDGLTKTGQKLFQLAVESYVYALLGAQAQTRWSIVSQGAKSLQTQEIFHRLVKDTITQENPVKAISDMRLPIENTNVVLNMAITPGIILIPSDMIILKEKVAGYNNVLTLATKDMKFCVNKDINYVKPVETAESTTPPITLKTTTVASKEASLQPTQGAVESTTPKTIFPRTNETVYLLGSAVTLGFLVARYVI